MGYKVRSKLVIKLVIKLVGGKRTVRAVGRRLVFKRTGGRWLARRKVTVC
jgi:hypothetical protein